MLKTLVPLAVAIALVACNQSGSKEDLSQSSPPKTSTSTQNPQTPPENSTAMNPVVPPQKDAPGMRPAGSANPTVDVQLTEYTIVMPDTLPAGKLTLAIANAGKENHGFEMHGANFQASLGEPLTRGDKRTLDVDLKPGTYDVDCPVDGHKGKGMSKTVTVK